MRVICDLMKYSIARSRRNIIQCDAIRSEQFFGLSFRIAFTCHSGMKTIFLTRCMIIKYTFSLNKVYQHSTIRNSKNWVWVLLLRLYAFLYTYYYKKWNIMIKIRKIHKFGLKCCLQSCTPEVNAIKKIHRKNCSDLIASNYT